MISKIRAHPVPREVHLGFDYVEDQNGDKINENEIINKINKEIEFDIFCARN